MNAAPETPPVVEYDDSLIEWFLTLTPAQRLAELESRVAFFKQAGRHGDRELSSHSRGS